jgi:hypothetical protein
VPVVSLTLSQVQFVQRVTQLIEQEQRNDQNKNQNKKEDYANTISPLYLIVGNRTEEQSP